MSLLISEYWQHGSFGDTSIMNFIQKTKKAALRSVLSTILVGSSISSAFAVDVQPGEQFDLITNETLLDTSYHWQTDRLTDVLNGDTSKEVIAGTERAWIAFDFPAANNLTFSLREDNSPRQQVTRWRVQRFVKGSWKNLVPWQVTNYGGWTHFEADPNINARRIRFILEAPSGADVGIRDIDATGIRLTTGEITPEPTPSVTPRPVATPLPVVTPVPEITPNPDYIGFFENKVFDNDPTELYAVRNFGAGVNDTARLQAALNAASRENNGGVVILHPSQRTNNKRYSLARIEVPSNVRIEVHPTVILEMRGNLESSNINKSFLFTAGRSRNANDLMPNRIKNVEITSTNPNRNFTIDAKTNMPRRYGAMLNGNGSGGGGNTFQTGVNLTRAIPVGLFYVENFAVSNIDIVDNHTESVSVQLYADTDYKDGAYARRAAGGDRTLDVFLDGPNGSPLPTNNRGQFINNRGQVIDDMFAIKRNPAWGRTPIKGSIKKINALNAHTGYGAVQIYGGDWVEIDQIESFNGIGVRVEAGNGTSTDNANRAGPYYSSMTNINISNVKVTNGFTGVWLKAHSKLMKNITVRNIEAINSGTALLVEKGTLCHSCRDLTRGRIDNLQIRGNIILRQTRYNNPVAEVGYVATFFLTQANRRNVAANVGKSLDELRYSDLPRNLSGSRWYKVDPIAPVLALSELSANEIGDQSAEEGFFKVNYNRANIVSDGLTHNKKILYRNDMRRPDGNVPTPVIYE